MKKLLFVAAFAACGGGGGGVDGDLKLNSLSDAEVMDECAYIVDAYPAKDFTCDNGNGGTVTVHYGFTTAAACTTSLESEISDIPDCQATVAQAEDCIDYEHGLSNDAFCNSTEAPAACAALDSDACSPPSDRTSDKLHRGVANAQHLLSLRLR